MTCPVCRYEIREADDDDLDVGDVITWVVIAGAVVEVHFACAADGAQARLPL
jgi:hypothetical protein